MTYGLDQCRLCGKDMPVLDSNARSRHEFFSRQAPTMTEPEWRAAGWKAAPTRYQLQHPLDGLCYDCKYQRGTTRFGRGRLVLVSGLVTAAVLLLVFVALRTLL